MRLIISLLLAVCVAGAPSLAAAEDPREVEGRAAFSKGDYARALDIFARLFAENGDPVYLRNIGRCHQKLRQPDEAIESFRNYLRRGRKLKSAEKKEVEGFIAEMEALKATMRDEAVASERAVAAEKAARSAERNVERAAPTAATPATAPTQPRADQPEVRETPAAVARVRRLEARAGDEESGAGTGGERSRSGAGSWHPPAALVGLGLTLIASGIGAYGIIHNRSLVTEFNGNCAIDPIPPKEAYATSATHTDPSCRALRSDYQAATRLAIVGFAGAAVLAGATLVVWLTTPSAEERPAEKHTARRDGTLALWSCAPGITDAGGPALDCRLRF